MTATEPLVCPHCARTFAAQERFCPDCRIPLVYGGFAAAEQPVTAASERARKVRPQFAEGELVKVAYARNQAEAEFIQGLLLEEGVPSVLRRARGFDVPDFLAAGPRDVLVPQSGMTTAREVLLQAEIVDDTAPAATSEAPLRVLLAVCALVALVAVVAWLGTDVL